MEIHQILRELRLSKGWSQIELSEKLGALGCPGSQKAISRWERGDTEPSIRQFIALCSLYDVRDVPAAFGDTHQRERLNPQGWRRVQEYIRLLEQDSEFAARPRAAVQKLRSIPLYELPVSAGTGQLLDSSAYTLIEADETVPTAATFAVRIRGDSMMPRFVDRQIIYVRQQQTLEDGEIGIFLLDGDAFCKQLSTQGGTRLLSLNPRYSPIVVGEYSELRVLGKVVAS